jgi:hypothetical protein
MEHRLSGMDEKTAVDIESLGQITSRKAKEGEDPRKPRMIKGGSGKLGSVAGFWVLRRRFQQKTISTFPG